MSTSRSVLIGISLFCLSAFAISQETSSLPPTSEAALAGHLSFLASDYLEGRQSPSVGIDIAAEYIASQFRSAGLEPVNGSYFQVDAASRLNKEGVPLCKNVVGLIRGSDPALSNSYLIVSAHYDHIGSRPQSTQEDKIYNGANDDASGTVAVIEIARALAKANPARSVLFICFYGEERGLVGSTFYGNNPLVPLVDTAAMFNIEMIGRTQKSDGDWTGRLGVTGYDFTDMGSRLTVSCAKAGIQAIMDPVASGPFFDRSDNRALAKMGVPAHTVSVGYIDNEYHKANDEWQTIDFANMKKVVNALAIAALDLANNPVAPMWNEIEATASYRAAWQKLHGG